MISRRDFIKTMSLLSGAVLTPVRWLGKWAGVQPAQEEEPPEAGELYAGFVLLPEGAKVPEFVQPEKYGMPNLCGVGKGDADIDLEAEFITFESPEVLVAETNLPIYALNDFPDGLQPSGASVIKRKSGELYNGTVTYAAYDKALAIWHTALSIEARVDFPNPFPIWSSSSKEEGVLAVDLVKVDFLPGGGGIMITTPNGFTLHWIMNEIYYFLSLDHFPDFDAKTLVSKLSRI
ncbi:MAG: hypothetical protein Fur0022_07050 [Anaerolineales bacterium]